jgi:hypothetical protein
MKINMGEFADYARAGLLFIGKQAAGGAVLPIYSGTTQQCGLFNPLGSGYDLIPVRLNITYVDTTGAAGGLCIGYNTGCGASIATGAACITAATTAAAVASNLMGNTAKGIFMSAGITTTAPGILMQLGINQTVLTAATTSSPQWSAMYKFNGEVCVSPGTAIYVAGNIATLSKFTCSISWIEKQIGT